ncbi:hypothetical protein NCAS_0A14690 [Naumovozyma castellii]|uniref:Arrestin C-terminal-like domain-containing protein n=1 Tax=Naumovozyma castellii TaxID=27288 RepID=G0V977_NAUCA|nr:hypothetical protein NCAS_0A14690 [Naumovozyma castellii CBS 4309]CCC68027.1 hypothetical protein NCAS_0A14690 [Naumovozyma castellii CBS 4309]
MPLTVNNTNQLQQHKQQQQQQMQDQDQVVILPETEPANVQFFPTANEMVKNNTENTYTTTMLRDNDRSANNRRRRSSTIKSALSSILSDSSSASPHSHVPKTLSINPPPSIIISTNEPINNNSSSTMEGNNYVYSHDYSQNTHHSSTSNSSASNSINQNSFSYIHPVSVSASNSLANSSLRRNTVSSNVIGLRQQQNRNLYRDSFSRNKSSSTTSLRQLIPSQSSASSYSLSSSSSSYNIPPSGANAPSSSAHSESTLKKTTNLIPKNIQYQFHHQYASLRSSFSSYSITTNSKKFSQHFLQNFLNERGFLNLKKIYDNKKDPLQISIASSGETIFLPTCKAYRYHHSPPRTHPRRSSHHSRRNRHSNDDLNDEEMYALENDASFHDTADLTSNFSASPSELDDENNDLSLYPLWSATEGARQHSLPNNSTESTLQLPPASHAHTRHRSYPSTLPTNTNMQMQHFHMDHTMTPHNIAVIISLDGSTNVNLSNIIIELSSDLRIFWNNKVPPENVKNEEIYKNGSIKWDINLRKNFNLFIPLHATSVDNVIINDDQLLESNRKMYRNFHQKDKKYINDKNDLQDSLIKKLLQSETGATNNNDKESIDMDFSDLKSMNSPTTNDQFLPAGDYVFILPILFVEDIPESIYLPSARIDYMLRLVTKLTPTHNKSHSKEKKITESKPIIKKITSSDDVNSIENESIFKGDFITSSSSSSSLSNSDNATVFNNIKNRFRSLSYASTTEPQSSIYSGTSERRRISTKNNKDKEEDKSKDKTNKFDNDHGEIISTELPLNIVRAPPSASFSTKNKPIYINKVWANSLSYEISFTQKYVPLNGELPIKIKLVPLVKNVSVKRIRVSIVEDVNFYSKDLNHSFNQLDPLSSDPSNPFYNEFNGKSKKERNLPLLEIRTREIGARALREEIVRNTVNDNLLSYNTVMESYTKNSSTMERKVGITEPITINSTLSFPKYSTVDKNAAKDIPPFGVEHYTTISNPEKTTKNTNDSANNRGRGNSFMSFLTGGKNKEPQSSPSTTTTTTKTNKDTAKKVIDPRFHKTSFHTNASVPVECDTMLSQAKRGLYLDSGHCNNIVCTHKLEIMMRVSKPRTDSKSGELRHFEVVLDTPIILVSDLCNMGNIELPTYDMATSDSTSVFSPPTFEEAISVPASPMLSNYSPSIDSRNTRDELSSIQLLNLSRLNSLSGPSNANVINNNKSNNNILSTPLPMSTSPLSVDVSSEISSYSNENSAASSVIPEDGEWFNNLDGLLAASPSPHPQTDHFASSNPFKQGYQIAVKKEAPPSYECAVSDCDREC